MKRGEAGCSMLDLGVALPGACLLVSTREAPGIRSEICVSSVELSLRSRLSGACMRRQRSPWQGATSLGGPARAIRDGVLALCGARTTGRFPHLPSRLAASLLSAARGRSEFRHLPEITLRMAQRGRGERRLSLWGRSTQAARLGGHSGRRRLGGRLDDPDVARLRLQRLQPLSSAGYLPHRREVGRSRRPCGRPAIGSRRGATCQQQESESEKVPHPIPTLHLYRFGQQPSRNRRAFGMPSQAWRFRSCSAGLVPLEGGAMANHPVDRASARGIVPAWCIGCTTRWRRGWDSNPR